MTAAEIAGLGYWPFEMVRDDFVLIAGRKIGWSGLNESVHEGEIIRDLPGRAFLIRRLGSGSEAEIYIERIKFWLPTEYERSEIERICARQVAEMQSPRREPWRPTPGSYGMPQGPRMPQANEIETITFNTPGGSISIDTNELIDYFLTRAASPFSELGKKFPKAVGCKDRDWARETVRLWQMEDEKWFNRMSHFGAPRSYRLAASRSMIHKGRPSPSCTAIPDPTPESIMLGLSRQSEILRRGRILFDEEAEWIAAYRALEHSARAAGEALDAFAPPPRQ